MLSKIFKEVCIENSIQIQPEPCGSLGGFLGFPMDEFYPADQSIEPVCRNPRCFEPLNARFKKVSVPATWV